MMSTFDDDSTAGAPRVLMDQPGPQNLIVADWGASTRQGSQRLRNEDSWGQLGPIFVVADGMGGLDGGDQASAVATRTMVTEWLNGEDLNPVDLVRTVNARVRDELAATDGGGTTLSALRIAHDQATIVHVGDSRIYRLRGQHAELLTRDHNLRTELLAAGIVPRSAQNYGPLRALTSYLGMLNEDLQVDVRSVGLRAGDQLILCTDGVFEGPNHAEFVDLLRSDQFGSAESIATGLTDRVGRDDATAMVLTIGTANAATGAMA